MGDEMNSNHIEYSVDIDVARKTLHLRLAPVGESLHVASNHVGDSNIALTATSACPMCSRLRHGIAGSPSLPAESSSSSCGLPVRFQLLPTPLRSDAAGGQ
jgi:hypothetical protein